MVAREGNSIYRCRSQVTALCLLAAGLLAANPLFAADENGWTNLSEENDLSEHWTTKGNWSINEEGVVTLEPRPGETGWTRYDAYLWLNAKYKDFEIEFDYKVEPRGNSGFYFHVGDKNSPVATGIEVQIYDSYGKGSSQSLTDHDSGGIIPGVPPSKNVAKPAGQWNHFHILCEGDQLTVKLNGEVVNEVDLSQPKFKGRPDSGFIGFQDHAFPLALRNIRIREL